MIEQETWLAKLALLGVTADYYGGYWFTYIDGHIKVCGQSLSGVAMEVISNIQQGAYR